MPDIKFTLSKPVESQGEEIKELNLREMTTKDIINCGYPFKMKIVDGEEEQDINQKNFIRLAAALAGVPGSTITSLELVDYMKLQGLIMGFFERMAPAGE
jgi:hypothetical protein